MNGKITGNSKIECGIGGVDLDLIEDKSNYKIISEKGIGSINIDGNDQASNTTYGNGSNLIQLERRNWKYKCKL